MARKLDQKQRGNAGKVLFELGRASFIGTVLARFIAPEKIATHVFYGGLVFSAVCFILMIMIDREDR